MLQLGWMPLALARQRRAPSVAIVSQGEVIDATFDGGDAPPAGTDLKRSSLRDAIERCSALCTDGDQSQALLRDQKQLTSLLVPPAAGM